MLMNLLVPRRALEKTFAANHHQLEDQEWDTASHPPDPH